MTQPTTVYVLIHEDHNSDINVEVYHSETTARNRFAEIMGNYEFAQLNDCTRSCWLCDAMLSGEGDYVRVERQEVRK